MKSFCNSTSADRTALSRLCEQETDANDYPQSAGVRKKIVIYDGQTLLDAARDSEREQPLKSELACCLRDGPGVLLVRGAYDDLSVIDRCTDVFAQIVAQETAQGASRGDHFGNNQRIWNALQKTAVANPPLFVDYYSNPVLRMVSESWLGPSYRITAQMNNIKPGGAAQSPHRDYHLGFQSQQTVSQFPVHAQLMSQYLTLQAAIAHGDMPIETGPTLLLPYSQQYPLGYIAVEQREFADYFAEHAVQLALAKGDALFFSPALFHAGGNNRTDCDRIANLIQVSSALGRTMETINHRVMIEAVYPVLQRLSAADDQSWHRIENVVAVVADGYSFPTNLDSDPPIDGNAPQTQQQIVRRALAESWSLEDLNEQLDQYDSRRQA